MHIYKYFSSYLLLSLVLTVVFSFPAQAAALRVIIVIDADDSSIGAAVDARNIEDLAEDIARSTNLTFHREIIKIEGELAATSRQPGRGNEFVKQAIEKLPVEQDDVVIFYYSGHGIGGNDPKWPGLAVEGGFTPTHRLLEMSWVKNTLWEKQPRLLLVIVDACNNFGTIPPPHDGRKTPFFLPSIYPQLFLRYQGYLLASSSKRGEYSIGGLGGGAFTNRFLRELKIEQASTQPPRWENIVSRMDGKPIIIDDENKQHPQFDASQLRPSVPNDPPNGPNPPVVPPKTPVTQLTCADGPKAYYPKDGKQCCLIKGGNGKLYCK